MLSVKSSQKQDLIFAGVRWNPTHSHLF